VVAPIDMPTPAVLPPSRFAIAADPASAAQHRAEVLVVGSGIAGLVTALACASERDVLLVTKSHLSDTNTWLAQGGIAGAVGEADSVELHVADTLVVGQGLCDEGVVRTVVGEAPEALAWLASLGVAFDRDADGTVALAREGGHSLPRVLHSGDATGAAVQNALAAAVRRDPRVTVAEGRLLVDLLVAEGRCAGALLLGQDGDVEAVRAGAVVLATGGAGQAYRVTTNPVVATGDGIAAAYRAGAEVADMEFVQFHPTALDHDRAPRFLLTEALRGEGAYLLDCDGERFMLGVHPLAELAPRDIVSREIERVMRRCGSQNVRLDARHLGETYLRRRFPTIWEACAEAGYDLGTDLVPVAPAAHYLIGGVATDVDGRSSITGLYAAGEVAATGLHGANRLASNSLLEGLVFGRRIARALDEDGLARDSGAPLALGAEADAALVEHPGTSLDAQAARTRIQALMSARVGTVRTAEGLEAAAAELDAVESALEPGPATVEARNLALVSRLIVAAARARHESRGTHFRSDYPDRDDERFGHRIAWRSDPKGR